VVFSVPDYGTALTLTGDEQQAIGLYCQDLWRPPPGRFGLSPDLKEQSR
jgi:hypothetical protein